MNRVDYVVMGQSLLIVFLVSANGAGQDQPPAPAATATRLSIPQMEVSPPAGFASDEAFGKWAEEETAKRKADAQKAAAGADRAAALLQTANLMLSYRAIADATRTLLGLDGASSAGATAALDDAKIQLAEAESALANETDQAGARLRLRLATLHAFSTALRASLTAEGESEEMRRAAASALAPLSEDPDEKVVAAANLWQAVLRSRESDLGPAYSILPIATADPKAGRAVYDFFGKILRCRLLGRESPPAALALLLQIEEHCHDWFENDDERDLAIRTVAAVRLQVLKNWCDGLATENAAWCAASAEDLVREHFADERTVLPLSPTIPLLESLKGPKGPEERPEADEPLKLPAPAEQAEPEDDGGD